MDPVVVRGSHRAGGGGARRGEAAGAEGSGWRGGRLGAGKGWGAGFPRPESSLGGLLDRGVGMGIGFGVQSLIDALRPAC